MARVELKGSTALITGASGGIGRALAAEFSRQGADIIAVARSEDRLQSLAVELPTQTHVIVADLERLEGVNALTEQVAQRGLVVDHLVNNAGYGSAGPFVETDEEELVGQLELNCISLTRLSRRFLPGMIERGRGGLLQVASVVSFIPVPYMSAYAGSKSFVYNFSASLEHELKGTGVHCTLLCPGSVETGFQDRARFKVGDFERMNMLSAAEVAARGVRAYQRRKLYIAPGAGNSFTAMAAGLLPTDWIGRISAGVMRKSGRDKAPPN